MAIKSSCLCRLQTRMVSWTQQLSCLHTASVLSNKNYYKVLGLEESCTAKDIRSKYVELCKKYHPDTVVSGSRAEIEEKKKKFQEVQEAYNVLSKESERKTYDYNIRYGYSRSPYSSSYQDEQSRRAQQAYYEFRHRRAAKDTDGWSWGDFWEDPPRGRPRTAEEAERQRRYEEYRRTWRRERESEFMRNQRPYGESFGKQWSIGQAISLCVSFLLFGIFLESLRLAGVMHPNPTQEERRRLLREMGLAKKYDMKKEEDRLKLRQHIQEWENDPSYWDKPPPLNPRW